MAGGVAKAVDAGEGIAGGGWRLIAGQAAFVVRAGYGPGGEPLIEFQGDHRADSYPSAIAALTAAIPGLVTTTTPSLTDDHLWRCRFDGGEFEVDDDWGGLFIITWSDHTRVIEAVADALERSGVFIRVRRVGD